MSKKNKISGAEAFEAYYKDIFGERWEALKKALLAPARSVEWQHKLTTPYFLDAGSIVAAFGLPSFSSEENFEEEPAKILDMCAAPGGKSLVLSSFLLAEKNAQMICNERSGERKARLVKVLDTHLEEPTRKKITVTGKDAATWCQHERDAFDRILVDAPCSSERHVLTSPAYLDQWTEARIRNLAQTQWAILSSAFLVLKPKGFLLYATCALAPKENDDVISRLLKKYKNAQIVQSFTPEKWKDFLHCEGEKTQHGIHVLPDVCEGAGPLYYCLIQKA